MTMDMFKQINAIDSRAELYINEFDVISGEGYTVVSCTVVCLLPSIIPVHTDAGVSNKLSSFSSMNIMRLL